MAEKESVRIRHTPLPTFLLYISFLPFPTELKLTATVNPSAFDKWSHPGEIVPDAALKDCSLNAMFYQQTSPSWNTLGSDRRAGGTGGGWSFARAL